MYDMDSNTTPASNTADGQLLAGVLKITADMGQMKQLSGDTRDALLKLVEGQADLSRQIDKFDYGFTQLRKEFDELKQQVSVANTAADGVKDKVVRMYDDLYGDPKNDGLMLDVRNIKREADIKASRTRWWSGLWAGGATLFMTAAWHVAAYLIKNVTGE